MTEDAHRQMGMTTNNETWRLLDEGGPGPDGPRDERDRFLYRAYASAFHWMEAADTGPANVARAEHLIACAAVGVGMPKRALRHARRCLEIIEEHPEAMEDWDRAFDRGSARQSARPCRTSGAGAWPITTLAE